MQVFRCPACRQTVWFDNLTCRCGAPLRFDPDAAAFGTAGADCANRAEIGCNWVAPPGGLCRACAMTRTRPPADRPEAVRHWGEMELAKRWVLTTLARWGWFGAADPGPRPVFDMLAELPGAAPVTMGHADGVVTLNVTEADPAVIARRQAALGELHRTLVGHVRHETAHVLFWRLSAVPGFLAGFRTRFGDERADYAAALARHYADPRPPGDTHVTSYATAHPHEDWAETLAHLLHLVDMVDSARSAGLTAGGDPYAAEAPDAVLTRAVDLSIALNHVNRAMGLPDLYPFVLSPAVRAKLGFVHGWVRRVPAPAAI